MLFDLWLLNKQVSVTEIFNTSPQSLYFSSVDVHKVYLHPCLE